MRIALIADVFPPLRSSGAVQLRDLSLEFVAHGHEPTVFVASPEQAQPAQVEMWQGVRVVRLKTPRTKDVGYARRTLGEFLMPYAMLRNLKACGLDTERWDGVVWYSPTIFLGPIASALKQRSGCRGYLIVRDIFPEWTVDMGLMGRGLPYRFFKFIERGQYAAADVIGAQTPANLPYFRPWEQERAGRRVDLLHNWLAPARDVGCSIQVSNSPVAGRKVFVYAGNMGIAQGMGVLLDLAAALHPRRDIGFLFVGRGSDAQRLRQDAVNRGLDNVCFYDEIDPSEIAGLYAQCHIGLVALDPRHKTHNIPGKFLSYMQSGLPVLASINPGNDLAELIAAERVGLACTETSVATLQSLAVELVDGLDKGYGTRCRQLAAKLFSPATAVQQIVQALQA